MEIPEKIPEEAKIKLDNGFANLVRRMDEQVKTKEFQEQARDFVKKSKSLTEEELDQPMSTI